MTAKRIQNIAFGLMILTAFSVYSAAKDHPMQTGKLVFPLILSLICYRLMVFAEKLNKKG